jgi:hypothetical protein
MTGPGLTAPWGFSHDARKAPGLGTNSWWAF